MKKFSYSLVLLCIAVSFLLLTCNPEVEGVAPMGPGSINVAKRSRSEVKFPFFRTSNLLLICWTPVIRSLSESKLLAVYRCPEDLMPPRRLFSLGFALRPLNGYCRHHTISRRLWKMLLQPLFCNCTCREWSEVSSVELVAIDTNSMATKLASF